MIETMKSTELESVVQRMVHIVWAWGESCGVDGVGFNESCDSANTWRREEAQKVIDDLYTYIKSTSETPINPALIDAAECNPLRMHAPTIFKDGVAFAEKYYQGKK
jgi:hypothetical protein